MEEQTEKQLIISSENIQEALSSKNFKTRVLAYQHINEFPEFIGMLQKETIAIAVEAALEAVLNFNGSLTNEEVSGFYTQFSQSKQTIRTKLSEVIAKAAKTDRHGVLSGLTGLFDHKNAKIVSGCVNKANAILSEDLEIFRDKESIKRLEDGMCNKLEGLFANPDKDVKAEASGLALTLYKILFDELNKYIENVKPILLKDLKEEFKKVETPMIEVNVSGLQVDNSDWKERLAAMNVIKENIKKMSNKNEVIPILCRKTKDANLSVVIATVESIRNGMVVNAECVRGMIERFKDKKGVLSSLIKETISITKPDVNILLDGLGNKNPEVKIGILECLKCYEIRDRIIEVGKLLEDSSAEVRKLSMEILQGVEDLTGLTEAQLVKLKKHQPGIKSQVCIKPESNNLPPIKSDMKRLSTDRSDMKRLSTDISDMKRLSSDRSDMKRLSSDRSDITCSSGNTLQVSRRSFGSTSTFTPEKYPELFDKDWNKRMNFICQHQDKIKKEGSAEVTKFLISSKETNFYVLKEIIGVLCSFEDLSTVREDLLGYLNTKITEVKLKDSIVELFKNIGTDASVNSIIQSMEQNKVGKKFICSLEILGQIVMKRHAAVDTFLANIKVFGMQEKKALIDFGNYYETVKNNLEVKEQKRVEKGNTESQSKAVNASQALYKHPEVFKTKVESISKFTTAKDVFNTEFVEVFERDTYQGVRILEKIDIKKHSVQIIGLYSEYKLPSPYFNTLILHLIEKKHIISEEEAKMLAEVLVAEKMESELELLDRIYPATKLYRIFKSIGGASGKEAVFNLTRKYKNLEGLTVRDIESAIEESGDFISLSFKIDKVIQMKKEMLEKLGTEEYFRNHDFDSQEEINEIEDSIIIDRTQTSEESHAGNFSATIIRAPSITGRVDDGFKEEKMPLENKDSFIIPPTRIDADLTFEIEKSLENISISTTPMKKKKSNAIETLDIIKTIKNENMEVSINGMNRLYQVLGEKPSKERLEANTVLETIIVELETRYKESEHYKTVLNVLLKFTQTSDYCIHLRYDTLKQAHAALVPLVKEHTAIADALINMCLNCEVEILRVYFDLLEDTNEVLMKLIWRHSKKSRYENVEVAAAVTQVVDRFFVEKRSFIGRADSIVVKICLLHLKECVAAYSDNVRQFGIGSITSEVVDLLLSSQTLNMEEVRRVFSEV